MRQAVVKAIGVAAGMIGNVTTFGKDLSCRVCVCLGVTIPLSLRSHYILAIYDRARVNYTPKLFTGSAVYFESDERLGQYANRWARLMARGMQVYRVPGTHLGLRQEPNLKFWAEKLSEILADLQARQRHRQLAREPVPTAKPLPRPKAADATASAMNLH
jgi:hypothetical protein